MTSFCLAVIACGGGGPKAEATATETDAAATTTTATPSDYDPKRGEGKLMSQLLNLAL